jgi:plastocyanin
MRQSVRVGAVALALSSMVIVGCGGDDGSTSNGGDAATPADVVMRGNDALKWDQKTYTAKAGQITIEIVNDGIQPHTAVIEKVPTFKKLIVNKKGEKARGTVTLQPGTYVVYCDVAGHRGAGMEAELVVS